MIKTIGNIEFRGVLSKPLPWVLFFITLRLILLFKAKDMNSHLGGEDGDRYLNEAMNLIKYEIFAYINADPPLPSAYDMPLYPFWLAGLILINNNIDTAVVMASVMNCIFFGFASFAIYRISLQLLKNKLISLLAIIIFSSFPETYPYTIYYMPDILFLALFTWSLFFLIDYFQYYSNKSLVVSSLLLGLSALTKPVGIMLIMLSLLSIFVWFILKRREVIKGIQASLIMFSIFSAILSPWVVRNFMTFGEFGTSTIFGTNLFDYNYRYMLKSKLPNTVDAQLKFEKNFLEKRESILQVLTNEQRLNPMIVSDKLGSVAKTEILLNFTEYIETVVKRHPRLYFGTGTIALFNLLGDNYTVDEMKQFVLGQIKWNALPQKAQIVQSVSWSILIILYAFAFFGGTRLILKKNWLPLCILLIIYAYFTILIGPVPLTRYRIMLLPSLSILGAYGLFSLIKKNNNLFVK
jgi:hypothetical protein